VNPREAGRAGRRLALDGAVSPAVVPAEQVTEPGPVVVEDHCSGIEQDRAAVPANLCLPDQLLVRVRDRLLLGEAAGALEVGATNAEVAGRMIRYLSRRAAGVHMVPAAVVVAAGHDRESGRQVERA